MRFELLAGLRWSNAYGLRDAMIGFYRSAVCGIVEWFVGRVDLQRKAWGIWCVRLFHSVLPDATRQTASVDVLSFERFMKKQKGKERRVGGRG